jgi:hypothetical protein
MVYFTLALALFQHDSCDDVAEHMVCGVPELGQSIPNRSSFTRARQRLGAQAIERVFRKLTGPLAPAGLEGSFYRGMRLAAVDGFVLDAPETEANRRRLGGPKDARGQVAGSAGQWSVSWVLAHASQYPACQSLGYEGEIYAARAAYADRDWVWPAALRLGHLGWRPS